MESLTAVVEHFDGRYELVDFAHFVKEFPMEAGDAASDSVEADEASVALGVEGAPTPLR